MAISQGNFSVTLGRDVQLKLIFKGRSIDLSNVTMFERNEVTTDIDVPRLDGRSIMAYLPKHWQGGIELARKHPEIDQLFADIDADWHDRGHVEFGTLYAYINEPNGSETVEKYSDVSLKYDSAGTFQEKEVKQKISFWAQRRDVQ